MKLLSILLTPLLALSLTAADIPKKQKVRKPQLGVQYITVTLRVPASMGDYIHLKELVQTLDNVPYLGVYVVDVEVRPMPRRDSRRPSYLPGVDQDGNPYDTSDKQ